MIATLLSGITKCHRLILHNPCPSSEISHQLKGSLFVLVGNGIQTTSLDTRAVHSQWIAIAAWPFQWTQLTYMYFVEREKLIMTHIAIADSNFPLYNLSLISLIWDLYLFVFHWRPWYLTISVQWLIYYFTYTYMYNTNTCSSS